MTMGHKREPMRERAYLNGWGKIRLKERRIDRARRKAALQRERNRGGEAWGPWR